MDLFIVNNLSMNMEIMKIDIRLMQLLFMVFVFVEILLFKKIRRNNRIILGILLVILILNISYVDFIMWIGDLTLFIIITLCEEAYWKQK